jgi:DnaJ-class molecular chaperone
VPPWLKRKGVRGPAYETLTDDEKRRIYDLHGEEGLKSTLQQQAQNPFLYGSHPWRAHADARD